ncbi:MAG: hypothetical protein CL624_09320, partial [Arcobacter sp.]|nr:hypothetical protein [Arcobacter sp.]
MTQPMSGTRLHRRYERYRDKQNKKLNKKYKDTNSDNFELDPLEQRVLLSADTILGGAQALLLNSNDYKATQVVDLDEVIQTNDNNNSIEQIDNNVISLDVKELMSNNTIVDSTLTIEDNAILAGSGSLVVDLINDNIVAPGYSPGIQNITGTYTQTSSGMLDIEISGTDNTDTDNPQYDQLNVTESANIDGTLVVSLIDDDGDGEVDYTPTVGDRFTILAASDIQGTFEDAEGLYGFYSDYYFDIEQDGTKIELVVKELFEGDNFAFEGALAELENINNLGMLLNADYFATVPDSVTLSGDLEVGESFYASGTFTIDYAQNKDIVLDDTTTVTTNLITFGLDSATAFFGVGYDTASEIGFSFNDFDLGLALFDSVDDDRSWMVTNSIIGSLGFSGVSDIDFTTSDLYFDSSYGFSNDNVVNLSSDTITVGTIILDDDGSKSERISLAGSATFNVKDYTLSGDFAFSKDSTNLVASGENVTAKIVTTNFEIGVSDASFGFILDSDANIAFESRGEILLSGANFDLPSADAVSVRYNDSGKDYTDYEISIANFTYNFGDFGSSSDLSEVSVSNLDVNMDDKLVISGDFAFKKQDDTVTVISGSAKAILEAGDTKVGVKNADLALIIDSTGKKVLQSSGSLYVNISEELQLSAINVSININETDTSYDDTTTISSADLSYTFDTLEANFDTPRVSLTGANLSIYDFINMDGDFEFYKTSNQSVTLSDSSTTAVDLITMATSNLNLFVGLNGDDEDEKMGFTLTNASFAIAMMSDRSNSTRTWLSTKASADSASFSGIDNLTLTGDTFVLEVNQTSMTDGVVVDYSGANSLTISSVTFDMDGSEGEILKISANLNINIYNFFSIDGGFSIEKKTDQVILSDASIVDVDLLTIGADEVDAFIGLNGGTTDQVGLSASDVSFAFVLAAENADDSNRKWISLQASTGIVSFDGVSDITLSAQSIDVSINSASDDGVVIDYLAQNLDVSISPTTAYALDIDGSRGELFEASGNINLNINNFFSVEGDFAIKKSSKEVTLSDASNSVIQTDFLSIGALSVDAFAGFNGGTSDAFGLNLQELTFALALYTNKSDSSKSYMSLQASANEMSFEGLSSIEMSATDIFVEINQAFDTSDKENDIVVDYAQQAIDIAVGVNTYMTFDMDGSRGEILTLSANLDIALFSFFNVSGEFSFEKSTRDIVLSDDDSSTISVDYLSMSTSDVNGFAGLNYGTSSQSGLSLGQLSFAMALMNDKSNLSRNLIALKADVGSAQFTGIDGLTLSGDSLSLEINKTSLDDGLVADFSGAYSIDFTSVTLDMDGAEGEILKISGNLNVNVFNFFSVSGGFALEKKEDQVTLSEGSVVNVDLLSLGASEVNAFVGLNGGSEDALGLQAQDVNFALLMLSDKSVGSDRTWISLKATTGEVSFVGVDDVIISADEINVAINTASSDDVVVDYLAQNVEVTTGASTSIVFDIDGSRGELYEASGVLDLNIYNFFSISGEFAFEKSTKDVTLSDGSVITTDFLSLGATGVDAFVGINGNSDDALGLELSQTELALAFYTNKNNTANKYISVQASTQEVSFVGIDNLIVSATDLNVQVNQALNENDTEVIDYEKQSVDITTGTNSAMTLDMDGALGELLQASGNLEISVFDFFHVDGSFGLEKSSKEVTLNTGETIDVDYLGIGATVNNAFAGLNYGESNELGLVLGQMSFALALMSDKKDNTRKFTSVQADIGSASFQGIDGLEIDADNLSLEINKGVYVAEVAPYTESENTILNLNIYEDTIGELTFTYDGESASIDVTNESTDSTIIADVTTALESMSTIGAGNVEVSGSKYGGFSLEFVGDLAGIDVSTLNVTTVSPTATADVSVSQTAKAGVDEITKLTVDIPRQTPAPV